MTPPHYDSLLHVGVASSERMNCGVARAGTASRRRQQRNTQDLGANSVTNSVNAGVAGQRWLLLRNRKSLKTRRPASITAGRVRLEGCCSIHLSYGRDVTAEELNARRLLVYGVRSDPRRLSLPSRLTASATNIRHDDTRAT